MTDLRRCQLILVALMLIFTKASIAAIIVSPNLQFHPFDEQLKVLEDPGGQLQANDVLQMDFAKNVIPFQMTSSALWYRLDLKFTGTTEQRYYLNTFGGETLYDSLAFYSFSGGKQIQMEKMGNETAYSSRKVPHTNYIYAFTLSPQQQLTLLWRIKSISPIEVRASVYSGPYFRQFSETLYSGIAMVIGIVSAMLLFSIYTAATTSVPGSRYYFGYVASALVLIMATTGSLRAVLWPDTPSLLWTIAYPWLVNGMAFFGLGFSRAFFDTKEKMPRLYKLMTLQMVFSVIVAGLILWFRYQPAMVIIDLLSANVAAAFFSMVLVCIISMINGNRLAWYFIVAWSMFLLIITLQISTIDIVAWVRDQLHLDESSITSFQFALMTEVLLFSMVFAQRNQLLRKEKLALEQQAYLQQSQVNAQLQRLDSVKDEFLANTSHELRTPLNGIIGMTEAMLYDEQQTLAPQQRTQLKGIYQSTSRLAMQVNDIVDFTTLKQHQLQLDLQQVNVYGVVEEVMGLCLFLSDSKSMTLENRIAGQNLTVSADTRRLKQILYNLLIKAIELCQIGGGIIVTSQAEVETIEIRISASDCQPAAIEKVMVWLKTVSTNPAVEPEYQDLGLNVCRMLLNSHGGQLWGADSKSGSFSLHFNLPVTDAQRQLNKFGENGGKRMNKLLKFSTAQKPINRHNPDVMILSTISENCQPLIEQLQSRFQLNLVNSLRQLQEYLAKCPTIRLVLIDLLPNDKLGLAACRLVRTKYSFVRLPVIMLGAEHSSNMLLVAGLNLGANDFICRPLSGRELEARIEVQLRIASAAEISVKQASMQAILDKAFSAIVLFDDVGLIQYANQSFAVMVQQPIDVIMCHAISDYIAQWQLLVPQLHSVEIKVDVADIGPIKSKALVHSIESLTALVVSNEEPVSDSKAVLGNIQQLEKMLLAASLEVKQVIAEFTEHTNNQATSGANDARSDLVSLLNLAVQYYERSSGNDRLELLCQCGIWKVYADNGCLRSRTFDRYLSMATLPDKPRWRQVVKTAHYVLKNCPRNEALIEPLQALLQQVQVQWGPTKSTVK